MSDIEKPVAEGGMSLGEGRELPPQGTCPKSPDGMHHYMAVSCIQSVEKFVCLECCDTFTD